MEKNALAGQVIGRVALTVDQESDVPARQESKFLEHVDLDWRGLVGAWCQSWPTNSPISSSCGTS
ncbi:hypothetical protein XH94_23080 [Bradyrhizobium zhanjiangense]|uniref:Uncharacterized protein n=1 Tax=Bradyrhizobium zhanjiangense TaxID=1325107 RepID=A0A4Q0SG24_9BRAD|nr:hypothetical protein XH94_23080 [Bradyrhizobium zhanjiangense]